MSGQTTTRLDVARGLSALVVFAGHAVQVFFWDRFPKDHWFLGLTGTAARHAVLVFFLLSGFLITKSILSNIERNRSFDPVDYLFSRVARIYPPFLFAVLISISVTIIVRIFGLAIGSVRPDLVYSPWEVVTALLLYKGLLIANGPLWSLYIEVAMYIGAMGIAMLGFSSGVLLRVIGLLVCAFAFWRMIPLYLPYLFGGIWMLGAIAAISIEKQPAKRITLLLAMASAGAILCDLIWGPFYRSDSIDTYGNMAIQVASSLIYLHLIIVSDKLEVRFPAWATRSSDYSYSLYVIHFPLLILGCALTLTVSSSTVAGGVGGALTALAVLAIAITSASKLENAKLYKRWLYRTWGQLFRKAAGEAPKLRQK